MHKGSFRSARGAQRSGHSSSNQSEAFQDAAAREDSFASADSRGGGGQSSVHSYTSARSNVSKDMHHPSLLSIYRPTVNYPYSLNMVRARINVCNGSNKLSKIVVSISCDRLLPESSKWCDGAYHCLLREMTTSVARNDHFVDPSWQQPALMKCACMVSAGLL